MAVHDNFARDYREARSTFLAAARDAGATLQEFRNPAQAPDGNPVFTDIAWRGPFEAERVLVTISGTHGAEGFCGSGVQVNWLADGPAPPAGLAELHIHALNPHGFAWIRRVTEGNVDLNRNFVDFSQPLPVNEGFEELFPYLCPRTWDAATVAECDAVLERYAEQHGTRALQQAISGGQYQHPDGIFFGGQAPTWSHRTLMEIVAGTLGRARKVATVDLHTGLGPHGHGERIVVHRPDSPGYSRAQAAFGEDMTSPFLGTSSATELHGVSLEAVAAALAETEFTACALEYGTVPTPEVRRALRADNWLHAHAPEGTLASETGEEIKRELRRVFYPDTDDWREQVVSRAFDTFRQMTAWLAGS